MQLIFKKFLFFRFFYAIKALHLFNTLFQKIVTVLRHHSLFQLIYNRLCTVRSLGVRYVKSINVTSIKCWTLIPFVFIIAWNECIFAASNMTVRLRHIEWFKPYHPLLLEKGACWSRSICSYTLRLISILANLMCLCKSTWNLI